MTGTSGAGASDAVVVGAGPAGSAAASVLATAGRRVLVLEKDVFPRHKVCGEFLSANALESLERIGARPAVEAATSERIGSGALFLPGGRRVDFRLPSPALGISRFRLDAIVAGRAAESGADVRFAARVTSVRPEGTDAFRVEYVEGGAPATVATRAVIGAWGRWDALDRTLDRGFLARRGRFFGWSRDYTGDTGFLAGEVRLHLFSGGYCGLSRVEDGTVNLAGVVSAGARSRLASWPEVIDAARRVNAALDDALSRLRPGPAGFLGTGPVFFTAKPPSEDGILMAGDAAGVIDPFSGEGQAAALASGILAAETVERRLSGELSAEECARAYVAAWRRRFGRRFAWSAAFRRLILDRRVGAMADRVAGERLVRFAIGKVAR